MKSNLATLIFFGTIVQGGVATFQGSEFNVKVMSRVSIYRLVVQGLWDLRGLQAYQSLQHCLAWKRHIYAC